MVLEYGLKWPRLELKINFYDKRMEMVAESEGNGVIGNGFTVTQSDGQNEA